MGCVCRGVCTGVWGRMWESVGECVCCTGSPYVVLCCVTN